MKIRIVDKTFKVNRTVFELLKSTGLYYDSGDLVKETKGKYIDKIWLSDYLLYHNNLDVTSRKMLNGILSFLEKRSIYVNDWCNLKSSKNIEYYWLVWFDKFDKYVRYSKSKKKYYCTEVSCQE